MLSLLRSCSCRGTKGRGAERCPRRPIRSWWGSGVDVAATVLAASHLYFFVPRTWSVDCYRVESVLYKEMACYHFSCWFDAGYSPSVLKSYLIFSQCSVCLPVTEAIPDKLSPRCKRAYQEKKSSPRELMLVAETGLTCAVYLEGCYIFNVVSVTKAARQGHEYQIAVRLFGAADREMPDTVRSPNNKRKFYNWP